MDRRIKKKGVRESSIRASNRDSRMRNVADCIEAVKMFEENAKDKVVIERITEKITQKCYEEALTGRTNITIGLDSFMSIVRESQGITTPEGLDIIEKLVREEISKYGFYVNRNLIGMYISWKEK